MAGRLTAPAFSLPEPAVWDGLGREKPGMIEGTEVVTISVVEIPLCSLGRLVP
jgi:hypothetical protein